MKQTLSILMILVLTLTLFSACGAAGGDYYTGMEEAPGSVTADGDSGSDDYGDGADFGGWAVEPEESGSSESYLAISENDATLTADQQAIAFSLKVDTAAYSNVARYLEGGSLPPADAVRVEELLNYFSYDGDLDFSGDAPFAVHSEVGPSPFDENRYMAFVRVATPQLDRSRLPSTNFTFLIDTSGSMNSHDKLPLLQDSLALLVEDLGPDDVVSIVTYAGSSQVLLDSVSGADKDRILEAVYGLSAGGSTAGAGGIVTAYALAEKNLMRGGNNRVILCSDGDFNVGVSSLEGLQDLIGEKRDSGVYLSVLGFGAGNLRDDVMETLAANGNGNYSYINNLATAQKVLVEEMAANLFVVAEDVKAQIEFNPDNVRAYRLIGYENRRMTNREFLDDAKDAGEIGVGTDVVMLFELELYGNGNTVGLRHTVSNDAPANALSIELFEVRIRYKEPGADSSREMVRPFPAGLVREDGSSDFGFACAVAAFGQLLRDSEYSGVLTLEEITEMARSNLGQDEKGYRLDFLLLLRQYGAIAA